jgi:hypothetical protein
VLPRIKKASPRPAERSRANASRLDPPAARRIEEVHALGLVAQRERRSFALQRGVALRVDARGDARPGRADVAVDEEIGAQA